MRSKILASILGFGGIFTLLFANTALSSETYTYTGHSFDTFLVSSIGVAQKFSASDHITFSFTTNSALAANTTYGNSSSTYVNPSYITGWSFSDGIDTVTNKMDTSFQRFEVTTDSHGNISGWNIALLPVSSSNNWTMGMLLSQNQGVSGCTPGIGVCSGVQDYVYSGNVSYSFAGAKDQGTWNISAVPEANAMTLMIIGTLMLTALNLTQRSRQA